MNNVYHGSKEQGLKKLEPRKSTHGTYVYATEYKELALHFCKRCGDDYTYALHKNPDTQKWDLIELMPGVFEKMYKTTASIYTLPGDTFKDIKTGFAEVVSETEVTILNEEIIEDLYKKMIEMDKDGTIKLYRYPNKPNYFDKDSNYLIDKVRFYKSKLKKQYTKHEIDRLLIMHPNLLDKINELLPELGISYNYEKYDFIELFRKRVERQLVDDENEQYIDEIYNFVSITYPELNEDLEKIYDYYKEEKQRRKGLLK